MDPIFIVGTERSGTNLLRLMLNAHSNICVPHPPHIFKNFFPRLSAYGDLENDENFRSLISDVLKSVKYHHYKWDVHFKTEEIFREASHRDLLSVFSVVYDKALDASGKRRWGCKSTFMLDHVGEVKERFPSSKFIYVVRDGRDVALSAKGSIFNHYAVYYTAHLWKREQGVGLYWLKQLDKTNILLVKYEDLVSDAEGEVKRICSFLSEEAEKPMLEFFKTSEAKKSASICKAWENTQKPIMEKNFGKFKKGLSSKEIKVFESIARKELEAFGYELVADALSQAEEPAKLSYLIGEYFLRIKVQLWYILKDKNSLLRYKKYRLLKRIDKRRSK